MTSNHKLIKAYLLLMIAFLTASGFALLSISYLPFESVKTIIDPFASDGNADSFTAALFKRTVVSVRFIGIALIFASGGLYIGRRQAHQYFYNILASLFSFIRELALHLNETVRKEDKIHLCAFFIIMLLAIAVRVCFLFQPMRTDEASTFMAFASMPLHSGLSNYSEPNNHLFHTFLVHMAYLLLGNQPWIIRLPALTAGILLVPASYMVTRIFYNKYAAILTAGIVASSSVLIEYSTNARGYTLICLIFLLILALATYLMQNRNQSAWLLFAILSSLGFYTIPIMLYPFGIVLIWFFLSIIFEDTNRSRTLLLRDMFIFSIITAVLTFMLYVPVFIKSGFEPVVANQYVTSKSWSYFAVNFPSSLPPVWNQWNRDIPAVISFFLVIGFFISLVFHKRLSIYRVPIILAAGIWVIPILIVHRVVPFTRVWLFLLPLYIGLASSGVSYLFRPIESKISHYKSVIFAILAIILSFWISLNVVYTRSVETDYYSITNRTFKDAEQVTIFLKDYLKPGDRVLVAYLQNPNVHLRYYFNLYNVPVKYLSSDLDSSHRILIIAKDSYYQTQRGLLDELDKKRFLGTNFSVPKVIQRYEYATLYEIKRVE